MMSGWCGISSMLRRAPDAPKVLSGFRHVLKQEGFAHIRVPDIGQLMRVAVQKDMDIDDLLYQSPAGPVTVRDVLYGYGVEIERSANDFYAHKTGFTRQKEIGEAISRKVLFQFDS